MDDISRQAAIDIVQGYAEQLHGKIGMPDDSEVFAYARGLILSIERNINALPSAQPEHGRWKKAYADHVSFGERPFYRYCSECCEVTVFPFKFCPNCGARMDEEADHDDHL